MTSLTKPKLAFLCNNHMAKLLVLKLRDRIFPINQTPLSFPESCDEQASVEQQQTTDCVHDSVFTVNYLISLYCTNLTCR